jgi:hypothetical protein
LEVLTQLAGSLSASLSPHWLGLIDLDGGMGLQQLLQRLEAAKGGPAAAAGGDGGGGAADGGDGGSNLKRKVEMDLSQLSQLQ